MDPRSPLLVPTGIDYVPPPASAIQRTSTPSPSAIFAEWTDDVTSSASTQQSARFGSGDDGTVNAYHPSSKSKESTRSTPLASPVPSTLYSRRQMGNEGKRSQSAASTQTITDSSAIEAGASPHSSALRLLRIDTSPTSSSRPAFHRRKSSLSSTHTASSAASAPRAISPVQSSSPETSEIATPTVSPLSSYTYTPKTTSTSQTCIPGSGCSTSPLRSAFAGDLTKTAEMGRPLLLRSISEDVVQLRRSVAFRLPEDPPIARDGTLEALQMQARALTYGAPAPKGSVAIQRPASSFPDSNGIVASEPITDSATGRIRTQIAQAIPSIATHSGLDIPSAGPASWSIAPASSQAQAASPASGPVARPQATRWPSPRRVNALAVHSGPFTAESRPELDSPARALLAGLDEATTEAIRRAAATVRSQAPAAVATTSRDTMVQGEDPGAGRDTHTNSLGVNSGIMGNCGSGFFGDAIREKVD